MLALIFRATSVQEFCFGDLLEQGTLVLFYYFSIFLPCLHCLLHSKSHSVKFLCQSLGIQLVSDGVLDSGDFNQNIKGDSERMINHIALRAKQVSHSLQLCLCHSF